MRCQQSANRWEVIFTQSKKDDACSKDTKETSEIYVHFIDILFAVIIGQSFVLLNSQDGFKTWLAQPLENAFGIATLLLVYGLVITSWVGYHRSTRVYPIKNPLRFVIDIVLLFLYYMGFVNINNFEMITWIFFYAFLSYTVWDALRILEYFNQKELRRDLLKRLGITVVFAVIFFVTAEAYVNINKQVVGVAWAFFVFILVLLIIYRYVKWYKEPKS